MAKSPRRLKIPQYKRGRYQKRIKHDVPKLVSSWEVFKQSVIVIWQNNSLFGGILLVYVVLSAILVRGLSSTAQLSLVKDALKETSDSVFSTSTTLLGSLLNSSTPTAASGTVYQSMLFVLISLVVIWTLRQVYDQKAKKISLKVAFYKSSYPLVPFVLVLLVISLQLVPLLIGSSVYALVASNGLAVTGLEQLAWGGLFFLLATWSFYMISSSLFALYIVTLPNVTPMQSLRSAKDLVKFRRWTVMRKILFLPLILFLLISLVMLPAVLWLTPIAEWIFFIIGLAALIIGHSYLYNLYRKLI